jgi:hypothetical protein
VSTSERTRKRCGDAGVEAALHEQPRPGARRRVAGTQEAVLSALACREPPTGRTWWTRPLFADRLVALGVVEPSADDTGRRVLTQPRSRPGRGSPGASPP